MLDATIGMPAYFVPVWRNVNSREMSTSERVVSVERFGRISTSWKSSLTSSSMRIPAASERVVAQSGDALFAGRVVDELRVDVRDQEPCDGELEARVARLPALEGHAPPAVGLAGRRNLVGPGLAVDAEPLVGVGFTDDLRVDRDVRLDGQRVPRFAVEAEARVTRSERRWPFDFRLVRMRGNRHESESRDRGPPCCLCHLRVPRVSAKRRMLPDARYQLPEAPPPPELPPPPEKPPPPEDEPPDDEPPAVMTIPPTVAVPFAFRSAAAFAYQGWRATH